MCKSLAVELLINGICFKSCCLVTFSVFEKYSSTVFWGWVFHMDWLLVLLPLLFWWRRLILWVGQMWLWTYDHFKMLWVGAWWAFLQLIDWWISLWHFWWNNVTCWQQRLVFRWKQSSLGLLFVWSCTKVYYWLCHAKHIEVPLGIACTMIAMVSLPLVKYNKAFPILLPLYQLQWYKTADLACSSKLHLKSQFESMLGNLSNFLLSVDNPIIGFSPLFTPTQRHLASLDRWFCCCSAKPGCLCTSI